MADNFSDAAKPSSPDAVDDDAQEYASGTTGSLIDDLRILIDDGQAVFAAELDLHKQRASFGLRQGKSITALYAVAAAFALLVAVGLVLGLLLALAPMLGAWGATAAVVAGLLMVSIICAGIASRKLRRTRALLFAPMQQDHVQQDHVQQDEGSA